MKSEGRGEQNGEVGEQDDAVTARRTVGGMPSGARLGRARGKRIHDGNDGIVREIAEVAAGLGLDLD